MYGHHESGDQERSCDVKIRGKPLQFLLGLSPELSQLLEIGANLVARKGQLAWYKDRRVRYALEQGVVYGAVAIAFGVIGMAVWFAMGFIAACMLEVVNYLEHYGLERTKKRAGSLNAFSRIIRGVRRIA